MLQLDILKNLCSITLYSIYSYFLNLMYFMILAGSIFSLGFDNFSVPHLCLTLFPFEKFSSSFLVIPIS